MPREQRVAEVLDLHAGGQDVRAATLAQRWGVTDRAVRKILTDPRLAYLKNLRAQEHELPCARVVRA